MISAPAPKTAALTAFIVAAAAAVTGMAPTTALTCGTSLTDFGGEFTIRSEPATSLVFDGDGGLTYSSASEGTGTGPYAVVPSGGFLSAVTMTDHGTEGPQPESATQAFKSTTFHCDAPSSVVSSFTALDRKGRTFDYVRVSPK
ncbi:hypothetical protein [Nocardia inohanensis]|uniref:hypothetical protein n=1 Tax=Nocardia inohanensis TaxID=209246 RepID=UPI00082C9DC1|nr:hypothetical protein [Nocardia inohanensis]